MNSATNKRAADSEAGVPALETAQTAVWTGDFGREYTDRNTLDVDALNQLYLKNYGITRTEINRSSLGGLATDASFLEVGCNYGNELLLLEQMGYRNISGVEVQPYALEVARKRLPRASLKLGSALALPFPNSSFDLVFTAGVLIHIAPQDLPRAMEEIHRCSRKYIWGMEYFAVEPTEIPYRNHSSLLWKMDYARRYLDLFPDLELVHEQRLSYLTNENVDAVYLLRKTS